MSSYYIDYENVHNEGLGGIEKLGAGSRVCLFYSCKADTLKIDVVRQLMGCAAEIRFEKIDNGVENALDFQLITALMCSYSTDESYYIISKDKGYDAAIEMAAKQGRDNIYRCRDIDGALKHQSGLGIDESDQEVIVDLNLDSAAGADDYDYVVADGQQADGGPGEVYGAEEPPFGDDDGYYADKAAEAAAASDEAAADSSAGDDSDSASCGALAAADAFSAAVEAVAEEAAPEADEPAEAGEASEADGEAGEVNNGGGAEPTAEELQRRAYQSICTKLLNHIKLIHKIPLNYKQAGVIYEALSESDSKMQFYHKLIQILGRKKGGELYQRVKTTYKSITAIYKASLNSDGDGDGNGVPAGAESSRSAFDEDGQNQGNPEE